MRRFLALLAALVASACADDAPEPGSLLARAPDAIFEEVGVLVPAEDGWGERGLGAWYADRHDGLVWSRGERAELVLHALAPTKRTLELVAAAPTGGGSSLAVELGGERIATLALSTAAQTFAIDAPAALWSSGDTRLALEIERTATADAPRSYRAARERTVGFGVGEVRWAEPRRVRVGEGELELADGTGVLYRVAGPTARAVELAARTRGDGKLTLRRGATDTRTMAEEGGAVELPLFADEGVVRFDGPLPHGPDATGFVHLVWEGETPLIVERLSVRSDADEPRAPLPNVIFVSVDTLAARHLSCYGYPRTTTPNIDRFAREAVLFEDCIANASWTAPSYLSQLSGLYPNAHHLDAPGVTDPQAWETNHLAASRWTLAEALRAGGYATAAWIDNPWVSEAMGMAQGFDLFDTSAAAIFLTDPDGGFAHIAPRARAWMNATKGPFFAFLQPMDPHGPYVTRWRYRGRFDGDGLYDEELERPVGHEQIHVFGVVPQYVAEGEHTGGGPLPDAMRTTPIANAYDEKIAEVDDAFGELLAFLDRRGLLDTSIVVLSSDHGEAVGQHEYWFDHGTLYDEVLRVPLIVRLPRGEHGGRRVATGVQLVDLMPTLLELTGQPVPAWSHGRSLAAAMAGAELPPVPRLSMDGIVRQETVIAPDGDKLVWSEPLVASLQTRLRHPRLPKGHVERVAPQLAGTFWSSARYAAWLAERPGLADELFAPLAGEFHELYALPEDPLELDDLLAAPDEPDEALRARRDRLQALLDAEKARGEAARDDAEARGGSSGPSRAALEQLEALGYLESGTTAGSDDSDGER